MKCWHCPTVELIWGGDHDIDDCEGNPQIATNLHCPNCQSQVYVYFPITPEEV